MTRIVKSAREWQEQLTPEQYRITRKGDTERAGSSPFNGEKRDGIYSCVCCGTALFDAAAKYESGSGWPSFFRPATQGALTEHVDKSLFGKRTEVRCAACDAHLGHVFDDGPEPTGLRYCMNGTALNFDERKEQDQDSSNE